MLLNKKEDVEIYFRSCWCVHTIHRQGRPREQKGEAMGNYEAIFNLIGSILGGVIIGAFCGAISLIVGIIKKKKALGLIGFFVSIAFGIFMTTVLYQPALFFYSQ